ncbi:MAG: hypothetical protein K9M03_00805 [Kiritimatiellales bacterium]|nr:hypothetical protein [Kiritimatiellales bacterium]
MKENRIHTFWPFRNYHFCEKRLIWDEVPDENPPSEPKELSSEAKAEQIRTIIKALENSEDSEVSKKGKELKDVLDNLFEKSADEIKNYGNEFYKTLVSQMGALNPHLPEDHKIDVAALEKLLPTSVNDAGWIALKFGVSLESVTSAWSRKKAESENAAKKSKRNKKAHPSKNRTRGDRELPYRRLGEANKLEQLPKSAQRIVKKLEENRKAYRKNIGNHQHSRYRQKKNRTYYKNPDKRERINYANNNGQIHDEYIKLKNKFRNITGIEYKEYLTNVELTRRARMKATGYGMIGGRERFEQIKEKKDREDAERAMSRSRGIGAYNAFENIIGGHGAYKLREERIRIDTQKKRSEAAWKALGLDGGPDAFGEQRFLRPQSRTGYTPEQSEALRKSGFAPRSGSFISDGAARDNREIHQGGFGRSYEIDQMPSESDIKATNDKIIDRNRRGHESNALDIMKAAQNKYSEYPELYSVYRSLVDAIKSGNEVDYDYSLKQFTDENAKLEQYLASIKFAEDLIMNVPSDKSRTHAIDSIKMLSGLQSSGYHSQKRLNGPSKFTIGYQVGDKIKTVNFNPFARPTHTSPFGGVRRDDLEALAEAGIVLMPKYGTISTHEGGKYPHVVIKSVDVHFIKDGIFDIPGDDGQYAVSVRDGEVTDKRKLYNADDSDKDIKS